MERAFSYDSAANLFPAVHFGIIIIKRYIKARILSGTPGKISVKGYVGYTTCLILMNASNICNASENNHVQSCRICSQCLLYWE